jgi:prepilin peptidase CpaA
MISPDVAVAAVVGIAASVEDLVKRRVSNWIPIVGLTGGIVCQVIAYGWMGLLYALGGAAIGFGILLVPYNLGGTSGGDVKLTAAFGAILGTQGLIIAFICASALGGLVAAVAVAYAAVLNRLQRREQARRVRYIAKAPAIAVGAWLAMLAKV